jgi:hypothetical protein
MRRGHKRELLLRKSRPVDSLFLCYPFRCSPRIDLGAFLSHSFVVSVSFPPFDRCKDKKPRAEAAWRRFSDLVGDLQKLTQTNRPSLELLFEHVPVGCVPEVFFPVVG